MLRIVRAINRWCKLFFLKRDITIEPEIEEVYKEYNELTQRLIFEQSELSIKRGEVASLQHNLLTLIEPIFFNLLAEGKDEVLKTNMPTLYLNKYNEIQRTINEHDILQLEFNKHYNRLEELKKLYGE